MHEHPVRAGRNDAELASQYAGLSRARCMDSQPPVAAQPAKPFHLGGAVRGDGVGSKVAT
jgi:hypothetical protein